MYAWFLKLPRAGSKARLLAAFMVLIAVINLSQAWPNLHGDLAIARWMAWFNVFVALIWVPMLLVILLGGRMPTSFARHIPGALRMSPRELHAAIQADLIREKQRSREL